MPLAFIIISLITTPLCAGFAGSVRVDSGKGAVSLFELGELLDGFLLLVKSGGDLFF
jgi:hypothetical protein